MKLHFLGGATEVGSFGFLLDIHGRQMLCDYGMTPSTPPKYPQPAPAVDIALLSHAHIDHSGMIPWLVGEYQTEVRTTSVTSALSELLARDSLKICKLEGYPKPYRERDIRAMVYNTSEIRHDHTDYFHDILMKFHSAGHIPGSTMFELGADQTVLFTGDINTIETRLLEGARPVPCDTLIIEATYAGRQHQPREEIERAFVAKLAEVIERGGQAIIPAFALGRTQELLLLLAKTPFDVWVDGMGIAVTKILLEHPRSVKNAKLLRRALKSANEVHSDSARSRAAKSEVILTTSGMLDGGPVIEYLQKLGGNRKNAVMLTGYQVEGTNGWKLMNEGRVEVAGAEVALGAEVAFFDFSAHAGHAELCTFIRKCAPENLVLCHSDDRTPIVEELKDEYRVLLPVEGQTVEV